MVQYSSVNWPTSIVVKPDGYSQNRRTAAPDGSTHSCAKIHPFTYSGEDDLCEEAWIITRTDALLGFNDETLRKAMLITSLHKMGL